MKKKISPVVGILVVLVTIGIALGVMWLASEAPVADKPSVPFWLREGGSGGGPPGPPAGPPGPRALATPGTPGQAREKATASPSKGAVTIRKPAKEAVSPSQ